MFNENPDYQIYIILFESVLKKFNLDDEKSRLEYIKTKFFGLFKIKSTENIFKNQKNYL